jgi:hypothetical protein
MERQPNTQSDGEAFSRQVIEAVWSKGASADNVLGQKRDGCAALMERIEFGNRHATTGWEIDHIKPVAAGGSDDLVNLQPLQWKNNAAKADTWPNWSPVNG